TLKGDLADLVVATIEPIRDRTTALLADQAELDRLLSAAADRASEVAEATLKQVYDHLGLLPKA
ncbi:MAG: tryptophan--tRNA ligase, partial [Actinomycetes bacterium]